VVVLGLELRRLRESLKGEARFEPLERQLILVFEGDGKGRIRVHGEAVNVHSSGTDLNFGLELDQSYLEPIIKALEAGDPASHDH
jgi:hypothetical protein